jgi:hypothetical protein
LVAVLIVVSCVRACSPAMLDRCKPEVRGNERVLATTLSRHAHVIKKYGVSLKCPTS